MYYVYCVHYLVSDPDGDTVRCRWADAERNECGGICRNTQEVAVTQDGRSIEIDQVESPLEESIHLEIGQVLKT